MTPRGVPMVAYGIDEVQLGAVRAVRSCCFEVEMPDGTAWLTADAVYSVSAGRVMLVCMAASVRSYSCLLHSPAAATTPRI